MFVLPSPQLPAEVKAPPLRIDTQSTRLPKTDRLYWRNCGIRSDHWGVRIFAQELPNNYLSRRRHRGATERDFAAILTNSRQYPDISSLAKLRAGRDQESSAINGCLTMLFATWLTLLSGRNPPDLRGPIDEFSNAKSRRLAGSGEAPRGIRAAIQSVRLTSSQEA
jgi:hypothetical protein